MLKKNVTSIILICATIIMGMIAYPFLPDTLAIQFGSDNTPSNAAPKPVGLLIAPVVMVFLLITRKKTNEVVHSANILESKFIYYIAQFVLLGVQVAIILYGLEYRFDINLIVKIIIGVIFIIVGNYLYRAKRSYGHGIKTRWTLSNEKVWEKTHKFSSVIFILAGITVILMNIFWEFATSYTIGVLLGGVLICYMASYVYYQKYNKE